MANILIVDDDPSICELLTEYLQENGHAPTAVNSLADGLETIAEMDCDLVLLDVQLPDGNGLETLPRFTRAPSSPEVLIITGHGDPDSAEKAVISGAWSYIEKPDVLNDLNLHLTRALQYRKEKKKAKLAPVALKRNNIIGSSKALNSCFDLLAKAASSDVSALVTGETGTGKELFARAIHDNSQRTQGNFVVVDCASLPENLIESTLFGHERGAFTGADTRRNGLIKHAHQGTLFLDEVGELPLNLQKKFLRVLQERSYRPVGASREEKSDFRLVAATNRNLDERVKAGDFRSDLLFRLKGFSIELPPLRNRLEDILELVTFFITRLCDRYDQETKGVAPDFIETLAAYDWPGNVRELYQTIEQVFADSFHSPTFFAVHLPQKFRILQARAGVKSGQAVAPAVADVETLPSWQIYKEKFEKKYIGALMLQAENNIQAACKISGISRTRLYQLLHKHNLHPTLSAN